MPWWTVPVGVVLGVALPVLVLSGMFWVAGEDWRVWRDEWRDLRDRERESERNRPKPPT